MSDRMDRMCAPLNLFHHVTAFQKYMIYSNVFAAFQKYIIYSTVFAAFQKEKLSDDWWPMSLYTLCAWTMMAQESHTHLFPCPVIHKGNVWKSMLCCIDNQVKNSLHTAELKVNKDIKELTGWIRNILTWHLKEKEKTDHISVLSLSCVQFDYYL